MAHCLVVGHSVNDLDCLGSLALAQVLYPEATIVKSGRLHPGAANLYTLFRDHLSLARVQDLKGLAVDKMIVLDTRSLAKIQEYLRVLPAHPTSFEIWDHHIKEFCDIPGAILTERPYGSNTTILALELRDRGLTIAPETATIALTGIYADTGSFSHDNVTPEDLLAGSWLLEHGAQITVVKKMLNRMHHDHQHRLFHEIVSLLKTEEINGRKIMSAAMDLESQVPGLAAVIDQVMEVEPCEALFVTFHLLKEKSHLIIARSRGEDIDLNDLLTPFGGGGHPQAASALLKRSGAFPIQTHLLNHLRQSLSGGIRAATLMREVHPILEDWSLLDASLHLERWSETGAPVVNSTGELRGILTLRDIQKARKHEQMHAPVRAYMKKSPITASPATGLREIEKLFYQHDIGHLPIIDDRGLCGMVTRSSYLAFLGVAG